MYGEQERDWFEKEPAKMNHDEAIAAAAYWKGVAHSSNQVRQTLQFLNDEIEYLRRELNEKGK